MVVLQESKAEKLSVLLLMILVQGHRGVSRRGPVKLVFPTHDEWASEGRPECQKFTSVYLGLSLVMIVTTNINNRILEYK